MTADLGGRATPSKNDIVFSDFLGKGERVAVEAGLRRARLRQPPVGTWCPRMAEALRPGPLHQVSRSVRALEDELGVVLLERTTREVRLTTAGAVLVDEARDLLSRAEAAVDALRDGRPALRVALHEVRPGRVHAARRAPLARRAPPRRAPRPPG